jgi:PAS domain-containing protein
MGQDPHIGLAEVWPLFSEIMKKGVETGKTLVGEKQMLHLTRYGYLEETYYDYRFIPIVGDEGYVVGHYGNPVDVTREVLNNRRAASAQNIGSEISACKSMQEFWPSLLAGFGPADKDFPLIALYATSQHASEPSCPYSERMTCLLEGCLGVSESQIPSRLILPRENRAVSSTTANIERLLATLFQKSLNSPGPLLVTRGMLPDNFLKGITWRGFGTPSQEFLIIPLRTGKGIVIGFIFTGLNPLKKFRQDCDFEDHVKMITSQLAIPRASSILQAEEIRQGEEKLTLRSNELKQSEAKYRNFAEHAPIGVALVNSDRCMEFANEAWYAHTQHAP